MTIVHMGSSLKEESLTLEIEVCTLWLSVQIYLSFIISKDQKLILDAESPFINKSPFINNQYLLSIK